MATTYTKAKFDKLKLDVAKATYQYGIENDSCETEMVSFIAAATGITLTAAHKLFDEVKGEAANSYTLTIKFTTVDGSVSLQPYLSWEDFADNLLASDDTRHSYVEDIMAEKVSFELTKDTK